MSQALSAGGNSPFRGGSSAWPPELDRSPDARRNRGTFRGHRPPVVYVPADSEQRRPIDPVRMAVSGDRCALGHRVRTDNRHPRHAPTQVGPHGLCGHPARLGGGGVSPLMDGTGVRVAGKLPRRMPRTLLSRPRPRPLAPRVRARSRRRCEPAAEDFRKYNRKHDQPLRILSVSICAFCSRPL